LAEETVYRVSGIAVAKNDLGKSFDAQCEKLERVITKVHQHEVKEQLE